MPGVGTPNASMGRIRASPAACEGDPLTSSGPGMSFFWTALRDASEWSGPPQTTRCRPKSGWCRGNLRGGHASVWVKESAGDASPEPIRELSVSIRRPRLRTLTLVTAAGAVLAVGGAVAANAAMSGDDPAHSPTSLAASQASRSETAAPSASPTSAQVPAPSRTRAPERVPSCTPPPRPPAARPATTPRAPVARPATTPWVPVPRPDVTAHAPVARETATQAPPHTVASAEPVPSPAWPVNRTALPRSVPNAPAPACQGEVVPVPIATPGRTMKPVPSATRPAAPAPSPARIRTAAPVASPR